MSAAMTTDSSRIFHNTFDAHVKACRNFHRLNARAKSLSVKFDTVCMHPEARRVLHRQVESANAAALEARAAHKACRDAWYALTTKHAVTKDFDATAGEIEFYVLLDLLDGCI